MWSDISCNFCFPGYQWLPISLMHRKTLFKIDDEILRDFVSLRVLKYIINMEFKAMFHNKNAQLIWFQWPISRQTRQAKYITLFSIIKLLTVCRREIWLPCCQSCHQESAGPILIRWLCYHCQDFKKFQSRFRSTIRQACRLRCFKHSHKLSERSTDLTINVPRVFSILLAISGNLRI